jgi:hypothetical protein
MISIATVSLAIPRRLLAVAALSAAVSAPSFAADPAVQRLALSCASAPQAMGCPGSTELRHTMPARATHDAAAAKTVKAPATRQSVDTRASNDGSRFQYDSCGCSGS